MAASGGCGKVTSADSDDERLEADQRHKYNRELKTVT
jgi:hypothetical protein